MKSAPIDWLVIIPVLALLALAFVAPGRKPPNVRRVFLFWSIGILAFLGLRSVVPDEFLFGGSESVRRNRFQVRHLLSRKDWEKYPVLILEGSSVTQYGVDGIALETELRRLGCPATVLQFCAVGANHFERLHFLESFFASLTKSQQEKLKATRVILLSEVFDAYDENPLYLLERVADNERGIICLTPRNAWDGWRAWSVYAAEQTKLGCPAPRPVAEILIRHVLFNRFGLGAFSSMRWPDSRRKLPAFFAMEGSKPKFNYEESRAGYLTNPHGKGFSLPLPFPQWNVSFDSMRRRLGSWVDEAGFFAFPTLETQRLAYQAAFARSLPGPAKMVGPASPDAMTRLLRPEYWYDGTHVTGPGAMTANEWLAGEITKKWPCDTPPSHE